MKELHIIYASIHSGLFLPLFELVMLQDMPLQHCIVLSTMVSNPQDLEETMIETMLDETILVSNFPPDSYYPENSALWRESRRGDELSGSWRSDSYRLTRIIYSILFGRFRFNAIYFLTGAPEEQITDEFGIDGIHPPKQEI